MQDNQGVIQLLEKMAADNEAQNRYLRKQLFFTRIFSVACCVLTIALLAVLLRVVPPLLGTLDQAVEALEQASETMELVDDTLTDIQGLFEEDGLVGQSGEALAQATQKISEMDIESLNAAIKNLGDVVEPLAEFFGKFKR
ncbi:MAG: hypothetical protein Q4C58_13415 [Eubacteriales bacterium]|nr:hypothetical protein [Eubacteriales bacterium]